MSDRLRALERAGEPGDAHAQLDVLEGAWSTVTRVHLPDGSTWSGRGRTVRRWVLGGRFLEEQLTGHGPDGRPWRGLAYLGHCNTTHTYQWLWMSDGTTGMTQATGLVDPSGTEWLLEGSELDPSGVLGSRRFRTTLTVVTPDRHVLRQAYLVDGAWVVAFAVEHARDGSERGEDEGEE